MSIRNPVVEPQLVVLNESLAAELGLDVDWLRSAAGLQLLCGNQLPAARPLAMAYCGHQFGNFNMLGDGRATLLGEVRDPAGQLWDLQYKGSGVRPFREGAMAARCGPMLREYLISGPACFGNSTTRTLPWLPVRGYAPAAGPGALIVRVAASHLRAGTFQHAAARGSRKAAT